MSFSPKFLTSNSNLTKRGLLPPAYGVRGKVMFWQASVLPSIHLSVHRGGWYPDPGGVPGPPRGVPGPPGGTRTPPGGVPRPPPGEGGVPGPPRGGSGSGTPPGQDRRSTHYTAGGMPLAFTQEDFLVSEVFAQLLVRHQWFIKWCLLFIYLFVYFYHPRKQIGNNFSQVYLSVCLSLCVYLFRP